MISKTNKESTTPPLHARREIVEQLLKDPLYGPRTQIALDIGRLVVVDAPESK